MTKPPKLKLNTTETASTKTTFGLHAGDANEPEPAGELPPVGVFPSPGTGVPGDPVVVVVEGGDGFASGDEADGGGLETWFAGEGDWYGVAVGEGDVSDGGDDGEITGGGDDNPFGDGAVAVGGAGGLLTARTTVTSFWPLSQFSLVPVMK